MHLDTIPVLDERVRGDEVKEWKSTYKKDRLRNAVNSFVMMIQ